MSSSPAALETRETRCLFCSACCEVGVRLGPATTSQPSYPDPGERYGICGRGHYVAELLHHPARVTGAYVRNGGKREQVSTTDGVRAVSKRLMELGLGSHIGVIVDGNFPCETIVGLSGFTKKTLRSDNFSVYLPAVDQAVLEGISATQAASFGLGDLAGCDVVLAIGDPFSAVPVMARATQNARNAQRGNRLIVIDPILGRAAKYATDHLAAWPGTEALVLAAIAKESGTAGALSEALGKVELESAAKLAGVAASAIRAAAQAVKNAKKLGVIIGLAEGAAGNPRAAAAIAATMAEAKGGGVVPAVSYGNAVGAFRVFQSVGAVPVGRLLGDAASGKLKALLVFGKDMAQDFAGSEYAEAAKKLDFSAAALPMPGRISEMADVTLPVAFWFEDEGTVIDFSGTSTEVLSLMAPPGSSRVALDLAREVANEIEPAGKVAAELTAEHLVSRKSGDAADMVGDLEASAMPRESGKLVLVPCQSTMNSYDGWLTLSCTWPKMVDVMPVGRINPEDLAAAGLAAGDAFIAASERGRLELIAKADTDVPRGVMGVPAHVAARSGLVGRGIDAASGALVTGPALVRVEEKAKSE